MSASIDKGPNDSAADSRELLSAWLDDYIAGRCDRGKMHESFLAVCRSNPEAPWDALALLDQYQRRGRVDVALARSLKTEIAQLVFGVATQTEEPSEPDAALDTTGSRWRKLYAERGSLNIDELPVEDPVTRALDPETRAPQPEAQSAPEAAQPSSRLGLDRPPSDREPARAARPVEGDMSGAPTPDHAQEVESMRATTRPSARFEKTSLSRRFEPVHAPKRSETPRPSKTEVTVGTVLRDRYELADVIEAGESSTLYRAFDRHRSHLPALQRYVAVRVFELPQDGRETALAALERQAYEAQSLSHPNIASVFDLDRHQDVYFVVMELLDGEPLSEVIRRLAGRPMSRERALAVIGAVGAALLHAHQHHIVHGDLKPAAIALTTTGDIKVLDFGFARTHALDHWAEGEPSVDGADAGTSCAYASAERIAGQEPHPRDDMYSLACIAYELFTGRHPYGGRSAALARLDGRRPKKPRGLSSRQWNALRTALQWNREARRIELADLLAVLLAAQGAQPSVRGPYGRESLDNPFGRSRSSSKRVLFAVLLIAAAGLAAWWQLPRFIDPGLINPIAGPVDSDSEQAPVASAAEHDMAIDVEIAPDTTAPDTTVDEDQVIASESVPEPAPDALGTEPAPIKPPTGAIVAATADPLPTDDASWSPARSAAAQAGDSAEPRASASAGFPTTSLEFDKDTYVVTESDGTAQLTVRRNGGTRGTAKFRWRLRPNSAEAGSDYADIGPGVEEIAQGVRTATITIPLVSDVIAENTEMFFVEIEAFEDGPPIGDQSHAAVIIVDDD